MSATMSLASSAATYRATTRSSCLLIVNTTCVWIIIGITCVIISISVDHQHNLGVDHHQHHL